MRGKKKLRPRRLPCEICGKEVVIQGSKTQTSKERFLELVRTGSTVRCERCGGYVLPGTARVSQVPTEHEFTPLGLRRKMGRHAKRRGVLESCPLGRCGVTSYGDAGAVND